MAGWLVQSATDWRPAGCCCQASCIHLHACSIGCTLHRLLPPSPPAVNGLTKSALEAIRASMALEELLLEEGRDDPPPLWGTMERLSPLLYTWAQGQITMLGGWMDRILAGEDWSRVSKQRAHGSR